MDAVPFSAPRGQNRSVMRPAQSNSLCIVMVCEDMSEADMVSRQLSEVNTGYLVTYRRVEDIVLNAPAGQVALVILATSDSPAVVRRTLKWLRHRWPRCGLTVVGDVGSGEYEMAAREGGAYYLTRPVAPDQWVALVTHVLGAPRQVEMRD